MSSVSGSVTCAGLRIGPASRDGGLCRRASPCFFLALALLWSASFPAGAWCVDYSERAHWVGQTDTPGNARAVEFDGRIALVADATAGLGVYDLSIPASPRRLAGIDTPGEAVGLSRQGDLVVVADSEGGIRVVDITRPDSPQEIGSVPTPGSALDVAVAGAYAYVADPCLSGSSRVS